MYGAGAGVPQDDALCAAWYHKAADQGVAHAQSTLGLLYMVGQGVPQDYGQAMMWCRKAADQGDAVALLYLGILYEAGWGVPQDYAEAHKWFNQAVSRLGRTTPDGQEAIKHRDDVAAKMNLAVVAEAKRLLQKAIDRLP